MCHVEVCSCWELLVTMIDAADVMMAAMIDVVADAMMVVMIDASVASEFAEVSLGEILFQDLLRHRFPMNCRDIHPSRTVKGSNFGMYCESSDSKFQLQNSFETNKGSAVSSFFFVDSSRASHYHQL